MLIIIRFIAVCTGLLVCVINPAFIVLVVLLTWLWHILAGYGPSKAKKSTLNWSKQRGYRTESPIDAENTKKATTETVGNAFDEGELTQDIIDDLFKP